MTIYLSLDKQIILKFPHPCLLGSAMVKTTKRYCQDKKQQCHSIDPSLAISNSYTMGCPPVRGDNPRALASGLSYAPVDKHDKTILYRLHQCRSCTS